MTLLDAPPSRTLDQRMEALREGNRIRSHRAQVKRDLKAGRLSMADVLADPDCSTMKLAAALVCVPKFGKVKVNQVLHYLGAPASKTCAGLSDRQQLLLLRGLRSGRPVSEWGK